jgi:dimeric dUTPase (all-alpha-NTP-PPase superfamily)
MFVKFDCELRKDYTVVKKWQAELESIRIYKDYFEFVILSHNIIHVIVGETFRGMFASFPDFKVCCFIYNFRERFDNFEKLSKVLIDIDAATVESALFYIGKHYIKG